MIYSHYSFSLLIGLHSALTFEKLMPELFTIAAAVRRRSVFEYANKEMGEPVYDVHLLSEKGGPSAARSASASLRGGS